MMDTYDDEMLNPLTRKEKIFYFTEQYIRLLNAESLDLTSEEFKKLNHRIINSIGITGLKEVKKIAWKQFESKP